MNRTTTGTPRKTAVSRTVYRSRMVTTVAGKSIVPGDIIEGVEKSPNFQALLDNHMIVPDQITEEV